MQESKYKTSLISKNIRILKMNKKYNILLFSYTYNCDYCINCKWDKQKSQINQKVV